MNDLMNNMGGGPLTMSSREIAELTGKRHPDVKRDIEKMISDLNEDARKFAHIYTDSMNRQQNEYLLDRELTETLLLGYSAPLRRKVIARLRELEAMVSAPRPLTTTETLIQMLQIQAGIERQQAEHGQAIAKLQSQVAQVAETKLFSTRPANSESIVHIRQRIGRVFGLSADVVDYVMRQSPYSPNPAGGVRNDHANAEGSTYTVWWTKDVTTVFNRFLAECQPVTQFMHTHPFIDGRFRVAGKAVVR